MTHDDARPLQLLPVGKCARRLGVNHGTVSRALERYPEVYREKRGRTTLVDYAALERAYRGDYRREVMSGEASGLRQRDEPQPVDRPAGGTAGEGDAVRAEPAPAAPAPAPAPSVTTATPARGARVADPADPARREKEAKADRAILQLAKDRGQLVDRARAEACFIEAAARMKEAARVAEAEEADALLSALHLPAERRALILASLRRATRRMLSTAAASFAELDADAGDGGTKEEVLERIARAARVLDAELAALLAPNDVAGVL